MDEKRKDFFWPSYVDLMTALFAIVLVLFVLTYFKLNKVITSIKERTELLTKDSILLSNLKANLKLFETDKDIFLYDTVYNRIQLAFDIKYKMGYQYYQINSNDIESNYNLTTEKLDSLGIKLVRIISKFQYQKSTDASMKDISYLMVISGSASSWGDEYENYLLSYKRALSLYKYWKQNLNIDFDSPKYHNIIELQIAGIGIGGVGRYNYPYRSNNNLEEKKNQRFIIYITPKIGK